MNIYKKLRKEKKLTQKQLAELIHVDQSTISKWEKEKTIPDVQTLEILSNFFKIPIDNLVKGNEYKNTIEIEEEKSINEISKKQKEIIKLITNLNDDLCNKVEGYIKGILEMKNDKEILISKIKEVK